MSIVNECMVAYLSVGVYPHYGKEFKDYVKEVKYFYKEVQSIVQGYDPLIIPTEIFTELTFGTAMPSDQLTTRADEFINLVSICWDKSMHRKDTGNVTYKMIKDESPDVILKEKTPIEFKDIVPEDFSIDSDDGSKTKRVIIIVGAPGVGKSTFAGEFCKRWREGKIAKQYHLVLLLRLREEGMSKGTEMKNIADLMKVCKPRIRENDITSPLDSIAEDLFKTQGNKTLFILEGFDELPSDCQKSESSIFVKMIKGEILPKATIMVTSRPWAIEPLHKKCHENIFQSIEILGFNDKQIDMYIKARLTVNEYYSFKMYLLQHPPINSCMYIPLSSAFVVSVYQQMKGQPDALPKTITELYRALALMLLQRYINREGACKDLTQFEDLPDEYRGEFKEVCKLAYNGIVREDGVVKVIFNDQPEHFDGLGLMKIYTEVSIQKREMKSYNFFQLTFQEYLAAVHIANLEPEEQVKFFENTGRYKVILRFLSGITKFNGIRIPNLQYMIQDYWYSTQFADFRSYIVVTKFHMNWMFEAQSEELIQKTLENETTVLYFEEQGNTALPLDYYSLGYCVVHSSSPWMLLFDPKQFNICEDNSEQKEENLTMLLAGASTKETDKSKVIALAGTEGYNNPCGRSPLIVSLEDLQRLFNSNILKEMEPKELWLDVRVGKSSDSNGFKWPNLSQLQTFHLVMDNNLIFKLQTVCSAKALESLVIRVNYSGGTYCLSEKECEFIGELLSSYRCRTVEIADNDTDKKKTKYKLEKSADKNTVTIHGCSKVLYPPIVQLTLNLLPDNWSLGYIIANSNCKWELELQFHHLDLDSNTCAKEVERYVEAAAKSKSQDQKPCIAKLKIESDNKEVVASVNTLFNGLECIFCLEEMAVHFPLDCSKIHWPDLSNLRKLHLDTSEAAILNLKNMFAQVPKLDSLSINIPSTTVLSEEDCIAVGELLSSLKCPTKISLENKDVLHIRSVQVSKKDCKIKKIIYEMQFFQMSKHVGLCVSHSNSDWILTFNNEVMYEQFASEVTQLYTSKSRIIMLRRCKAAYMTKCQPLPMPKDSLNFLFIKLRYMLCLEELVLELPVDCTCIEWPDLSQLRVLHLGLSGKQEDWQLNYLLSRLTSTLQSLKITSNPPLCNNDCIEIGKLLSRSKCSEINITVKEEYCITTDIKVDDDKRKQEMKEKRILEMILFNVGGNNENKSSAGLIISYSSSQWILTLCSERKDDRFVPAKRVRLLSEISTNTKVISVRGRIKSWSYYSCHPSVFDSTESLTTLFTDMKQMLCLEELALELPAETNFSEFIPYMRDLSQLRILDLVLKENREWKLSSLLPHLTLNNLKITSTFVLCKDDNIAIGELLSYSHCPQTVVVMVENVYCIANINDVDKKVKNKKKGRKEVEMIIFNENDTNFRDSVEDILTASSCNWMLTFCSTKENPISENKTIRLRSTNGTNAKVLSIRGGIKDYTQTQSYGHHPCVFDSFNSLQAFFCDIKPILCLEELAVELPIGFTPHPWPNLSQLRIMNLGISRESNWKLQYLLQLLDKMKLDSLKIKVTSNLPKEDYDAIGRIFSPQTCPLNVSIELGENKITFPTVTKSIHHKDDRVGREATLLVEMTINTCSEDEYLGRCIAFSSGQWILVLNKSINYRTLLSGISSCPNSGSYVLKLIQRYGTQGNKSIEKIGLNTLFTDMKDMLRLEEMVLQLQVKCSSIQWPDLSRLRGLHLIVCGKQNWELSCLLKNLKLDTLIISDINENPNNAALCGKDCEAIGKLYTPSCSPRFIKFLNYAHIQSENSFDGALMVIYNQTPYIEFIGHCIRHSCIKWTIAFENQKWNKNISTLIRGAKSEEKIRAQVVGLMGVEVSGMSLIQRPLFISKNTFNSLIKDLGHMVCLESLVLNLPVPCDRIQWPDLSHLSVLKLGLSGDENWNLISLELPKLQNLEITGMSRCILKHGDCTAIGNLLSPAQCPKRVMIEIKDSFCIQGPIIHPHGIKNFLRMEIVVYDVKNQPDVAACISSSNCEWIMTLIDSDQQSVDAFKPLQRVENDAGITIVGLRSGGINEEKKFYDRPLSTTTGVLKTLFTYLNHLMKLEQLSLRLTEDCSQIVSLNLSEEIISLDLSRLEELHIEISGNKNWKLNVLLQLNLTSLTITDSSVATKCILDHKDCKSIGEILSPAKCPPKVRIEMTERFCIRRPIQVDNEADHYEIQRLQSSECLLEAILFDSGEQSDLGYCITYSHCKWILTFVDKDMHYIRSFATAATTALEISARVEAVRGGEYKQLQNTAMKRFYSRPLSAPDKVLNTLFTDVKPLLNLKEVSLKLCVDCWRLLWPNLSQLKALHLVVNAYSWQLSHLIKLLPKPMKSLKIIIDSVVSDDFVSHEYDFEAIGKLLWPSKCPNRLIIEIVGSFCIKQPANVMFQRRLHLPELLIEVEIYDEKNIGNLVNCIVSSNCEWILTFMDTKADIIDRLVDNIKYRSRRKVSSKVVEARLGEYENTDGDSTLRHFHPKPLSIPIKPLNNLFTGINHLMKLYKLNIELTESCSTVSWPDFSHLQILNIVLNCEQNSGLSAFLQFPLKKLESLSITVCSDCTLNIEDCIALGKFLSVSKCLKIKISGTVTILRPVRASSPSFNMLDLSQNPEYFIEMEIFEHNTQDYLGEIITYSNCKWVLTVDQQLQIPNLYNFIDAVRYNSETSAKIVELRTGEYRRVRDGQDKSQRIFHVRPLSAAPFDFNTLFDELHQLIRLQKLSLKLWHDMDCSSIKWPDLTQLKEMNLVICKATNWKLNYLPKLRDVLLIITTDSTASDTFQLHKDDSIAIGKILSPTSCPQSITIKIGSSFCIQQLHMKLDNELLVEMDVNDSKNLCSLGYCIAHSKCKWILKLPKLNDLIKLTSSMEAYEQELCAKVVVVKTKEIGDLSEGSNVSCKPLLESSKEMFTKMQRLFELEELHLNLKYDCGQIQWPDISKLRVLDLVMSRSNNWKLGTLLQHPDLMLSSLKILISTSCNLDEEDSIAIGTILNPSSKCPKYMTIELMSRFCIKRVDITESHPFKNMSSSDMLINVMIYDNQESLGYAIRSSSCKWILTFYTAEEEGLKSLISTIRQSETSARVVGLVGGKKNLKNDRNHQSMPLSASVGFLNTFFTDMEPVLELQHLNLELKVGCGDIHWPNLKQLRVLHINISGNKVKNWGLFGLLQICDLTLGILKIKVSARSVLNRNDYIAIGKLLSPQNCPSELKFKMEHSFCIRAVRSNSEMKNRFLRHLLQHNLDLLMHIMIFDIQNQHLGECIASSKCNWVLTFVDVNPTGIKRLTTALKNRTDSRARVVSLSGSIIHSPRAMYHDGGYMIGPFTAPAGVVNDFFNDMKGFLELKHLSIKLTEDAADIIWPDLSQLKELNLSISKKGLWKLSNLLQSTSLKLMSLNIKASGGCILHQKDCIAIGIILSSNCPPKVRIEVQQSFCIQKPVESDPLMNRFLISNSRGKLIEMIVFDIKDQKHLGECIAYSNCKWVLTIFDAEEKGIRSLADGINSEQDTRAQVIALRGFTGDSFNDNKLFSESASVSVFNIVFQQMKKVMLEHVHLELTGNWGDIHWPDFSHLKEMNLLISKEVSGALTTLLQKIRSHLQSLIIRFSAGYTLYPEDYTAIGIILSPSKCPREVVIELKDRFCIRNVEEYIPFLNNLFMDLMIFDIRDQAHLGLCIAYSNCKWIVNFFNVQNENIRCFSAVEQIHTPAKVVGLTGGSMERSQTPFIPFHKVVKPFSASATVINSHFADLKPALQLENMFLQLPVDCVRIKWPDFSNLQALNLVISTCGEPNWKLYNLIKSLWKADLRFLKITACPECIFSRATFTAIGKYISNKCPPNMTIEIKERFWIRNIKKQEELHPFTMVFSGQTHSTKALIDLGIFDIKYHIYLDHCIAHSNCKWILTIFDGDLKSIDTLATEMLSRSKEAKIVGLRGGKSEIRSFEFGSHHEYHYSITPLSVSSENLITFFNSIEQVVKLEQLHVRLNVVTSDMRVPTESVHLSNLQELDLHISGDMKWELSSFFDILPETLTIIKINITAGYILQLEDCIQMGNLLRCSKRAQEVKIELKDAFCVQTMYLPGPKMEMMIFDIKNLKKLCYCITNSKCKWVLTIFDTDLDYLLGTSVETPRGAGVVELRGGNVELLKLPWSKDSDGMRQYSIRPLSVSVVALNGLFARMSQVMTLEVLNIKFSLERTSIHWPNLSKLQHLDLAINGDGSWNLAELLKQLGEKLTSLKITASSGIVVDQNTYSEIGKYLSRNYLLNYFIQVNGKFCIQSARKPFPFHMNTTQPSDQLVEMVILDENNLNLEHCIADSSCKWILTLIVTEKKGIQNLAAGFKKKLKTNARVVCLRGGKVEIDNDEENYCFSALSISHLALNILFSGLKHVMKLKQLSLKLPHDCIGIDWPNISELQELHLQINGYQNWQFSRILRGELKSLIIEAVSPDVQLHRDDYEYICDFLFRSEFLEQFILTFDDSSNAKQITLSSINSLFQAIAYNSSLPLHTLKIDCNCVITSADAKHLEKFVMRERSSLKRFRMGWCTLNGQDYQRLSKRLKSRLWQETETSFHNITIAEEDQMTQQRKGEEEEEEEMEEVMDEGVHFKGLQELLESIDKKNLIEEEKCELFSKKLVILIHVLFNIKKSIMQLIN